MHTRILTLLLTAPLCGQNLASLPVEPDGERTAANRTDWLIDPSPFKAGVFRSADGKELVLRNGLVRRALRLSPNAATVAVDNLASGQSMLRGVKPEARIELDGQRFAVGGLDGQPDYAFLREEWVDRLTRNPRAFRFESFRVGKTVAPFAWKRVRHHDTAAQWPPAGITVAMDYTFPELAATEIAVLAGATAPSNRGRTPVFVEPFANASRAWRIHRSAAHARSSFTNEGKFGEIMTPANTACYAERTLPQGVRLAEVTLDAGTDRSASWGPGVALVFPNRVVKFNLRPGGDGSSDAAEFGAFDGRREIAHLGNRQRATVEQPWTLRMRIEGTSIHLETRSGASTWRSLRVLRFRALGEPTALRVGKLDSRGGGADFGTPGALVRTRLIRCAAYRALDAAALAAQAARWAELRKVKVTVHYELYDGLPCFAKWITVHNGSSRRVTLDRFTSEILALVEPESRVETRAEVPFATPNVWVETDYAAGGSDANGQRWSVHWETDPDYKTQVNYLLQMPCVLACKPSVGPDQDIAPGDTFRSFKSFVLLHDSWERGRNGLARRRMYRTIAPWITENPLMMHVRRADWPSVKLAIDQCAAVGFEMVILTFGSGFNIENASAKYLATLKRYADYAREKGIEIGGYSLFSSRRIGDGNDVVSPPGQRPTHGNCPASTSAWGQKYFAKLYAFFAKTGFTLLEHDGPYPGDFDITARPPLQKGYADSQWVQFWISANFYRWCREHGIYLNTPDWYFLNGSTKSAMGYREVNWSLPRAQQVIHTRQNIFDGTWTKTPTMGWMFVPLTQYQGGGAAATVEPLDAHRDHYRRMLEGNLGAGVQACYRGPRLFDTPATMQVVKARVAWFKKYRAILESDIIHGSSRRADGRDLDWLLHANPKLATTGMLVVYNPLDHEVERTIELGLYYTGLQRRATLTGADDDDYGETGYDLDRKFRIRVRVKVAAGSMRWFAITGD